MKRWLKKLTNGESREVYTKRKIAEINNSILPPVSEQFADEQPVPAAIEVVSYNDTYKQNLKDENRSSFNSIELE